MKSFLSLAAAVFIFISALPADAVKKITVSANLEIIQISKNAFIHVSYSESQWGRIASNGLILVQEHQAFLFDTPMDELTTMELVKFIRDSLQAVVTGFVPNHWHSDCIGGLDYLHRTGVESYAHRMTAELALKSGLPVPRHTFADSLKLKLGSLEILCYYPGPAHSMDNIVVWIPEEKILFAGCMVKEMSSANMGNTADGDVKAWPGTIQKVMERFPGAVTVIPGHGKYGGLELLKHTLDLSKNKSE